MQRLPIDIGIIHFIGIGGIGMSGIAEIHHNLGYKVQGSDISENQNEKVFIFNGWTFASDPTIAPFDHAIYDLQLVNCGNV